MAFYTRLLNMVDRLLTQYGAQYSYTSTQKGAYVPSTDSYVDNSLTYTVTLVLGGSAINEFLGKTLVRVEEQRALLNPKGITFIPKTGDIVTIDSKSFFVDGVIPINSAGVIVLWILSLKLGK
jgi:hypothetical protein